SFLLRPGPLRLHSAVVALALAMISNPARADDLSDLLQQQAEDPGDMGLAEQVGGALYQAGRYAEAARVLEQVAAHGNSQQQQRARYNAGLARYSAGQLTAALEDWQQILEQDSAHTAAQQNTAAVQAELQARMQPPEEQPPEEQPQDGEPQDGEPQDGEPQDGESQDGESQDGESQSQDGEEQDGTMEEPGELQELGDTGEQEAAAEAVAQEGADGEESESGEDAQATAAPQEIDGEMSEDAARRLLESVEEGEPRVQVGEQSKGGNDW
ncbi:MAG: tetratricopeptide (TPR) repeat protein, partial [Myxococcota bacterium]